MAPTGMTSDANTFALWRFENTSGGETDYSGNARDLTLNGTCPQVSGFVGNARRIISSGGGRFQLATSVPLATFFSGNTWTIEALVKINGSSGGGPILVISKQSNQVYGGLFRVFKDFLGFGGSGGAPGFTEQVAINSISGALPADEWTYIALVGTGIVSTGAPTGFGGPLFDHLYFYVNGILRAVTLQAVGVSAAADAAPGSDLIIGDYWQFPTGVFANAGAGMDFNEIRMSDRCRTPTEIADQAIAYELLGSPAVSVDNTPPVISNVTPAANASIAVDQVIGLDVTDNLDSFTRIILRVKIVGQDIDEVAHDGDSFTAKYQGASNDRSVIADGFHYDVLRDGGWTVGDAPIFTVYAIDTDGNEDV